MISEYKIKKYHPYGCKIEMGVCDFFENSFYVVNGFWALFLKSNISKQKSIQRKTTLSSLIVI